ncbi:MAG: GNAT family N-acetyltransferase [Spirochaetes bacterium]|nr:GNAT family N-acetyltransferase [Spirochaetota bacterium]
MPAATENRIASDHFVLARLEINDDFCEACTDFDCGKQDLNDFFQNDAFEHKSELLAETYYFQPIKAEDEGLFYPVALISYLNDYIPLSKEERRVIKKSFWKHLEKNVPHKLRGYSSFPAVKIGRLGVNKKYQRNNIGTHLLNLTKQYFLKHNKTGCRFITVDAYNDQITIDFYKKNGFQFLWEEDKKKQTRTMYFDLKRFKNQSAIP